MRVCVRMAGRGVVVHGVVQQATGGSSRTACRPPSFACLPAWPADVGSLPGDRSFWRFNRTQDYGFKGDNETPEQLTATFGR